jgi:hypothetical protein
MSLQDARVFVQIVILILHFISEQVDSIGIVIIQLLEFNNHGKSLVRRPNRCRALLLTKMTENPVFSFFS